MLTRFSQTLARAAYKRWPEWRDCGPADLWDVVDLRHFSVEIPPVNPRAERGLRMWNRRGSEIIVGFDADHCHIKPRPEETSTQVIRRALDFAEAFLTDQLLAISWWEGTSLRMTSSMKPRRSMPTGKRWKTRCPWTKFRARSWSGKLDFEVNRAVPTPALPPR